MMKKIQAKSFVKCFSIILRAKVTEALKRVTSLDPPWRSNTVMDQPGVAALKKYFDGSISSPASNRLVNAHRRRFVPTILKNVGKTACHHTFFEMLGNFSIGKTTSRKQFIAFAWEFLVSGVGVDRSWIRTASMFLFIPMIMAYDIRPSKSVSILITS